MTEYRLPLAAPTPNLAYLAVTSLRSAFFGAINLGVMTAKIDLRK